MGLGPGVEEAVTGDYVDGALVLLMQMLHRGGAEDDEE
jgi:hypothetical protein